MIYINANHLVRLYDVKIIDISFKDTNRKIKPSTQRISKRDRGTSRQKILKRKRKQTKQFVAMISMAKNIHKYKYSRHSKTAENFLEAFANLSMLDGGETNETHTLAYSVGRQVPNPNILNHDTAMKAVDSDKFEVSMAEELDKMWNNKIYEIIKKSDVLKGRTILRSVWSHRRKKKPDGNI